MQTLNLLGVEWVASGLGT